MYFCVTAIEECPASSINAGRAIDATYLSNKVSKTKIKPTSVWNVTTVVSCCSVQKIAVGGFVGACFGCCSVGIRAWHDCSVFWLDTEACEARLCGMLWFYTKKDAEGFRKAAIFVFVRASIKKHIAKWEGKAYVEPCKRACISSATPREQQINYGTIRWIGNWLA